MWPRRAPAALPRRSREWRQAPAPWAFRPTARIRQPGRGDRRPLRRTAAGQPGPRWPAGEWLLPAAAPRGSGGRLCGFGRADLGESRGKLLLQYCLNVIESIYEKHSHLYDADQFSAWSVGVAGWGSRLRLVFPAFGAGEGGYIRSAVEMNEYD